MQVLRRLLRDFFKQHFLLSLLVWFLDLAANCLLILLSLTAAQAYTVLLGVGSGKGRFLEQLLGIANWNNLQWLYLLGGMILLRTAIDFGRQALRGRLGEYFTLALRRQLFGHQLKMNRTHYSEKGAGRFLLRFSGDLNSLQQLFTKGILSSSSDAGLILISLVCFFYLDAWIGGLILLVLLITLAVVVWQNVSVAKREEERRNKKSAILAFVSLYLPYVPSIQALNRERPIRERFGRKAEKLTELSVTYWAQVAGITAIIPLAVYACLWVVLYHLTVSKGTSQALAPDTLLTIILLLLSWRPVLSRLLQAIFIWQKGLISARKIANLLDRSTEEIPAEKTPAQTIPYAPLRVENLSVVAEEHCIFRNLNFSLDGGEMVVITAPGGGGKTLLVRILAGVQKATTGSIALGDFTQQQIRPKTWRKRLSFVSTAFPLFGRNILEAIAYSKRQKYTVAAAEIWQEWQTLFPCLHGLQLDHRLGDHSSNLSAGQERLLLWLRAILSDKKIIVVDEGLAGLDRQSQEKLLGWLAANKAGTAYLWLTKKEESLLQQLHPARKLLRLRAPQRQRWLEGGELGRKVAWGTCPI